MRILPLLFLILFATSCKKDIPAWNGKIYVMWPAKDAIVRSQDPVEPLISAQNPKVHGWVVMSREDFTSFVKTYIVNCKEWHSGPMVSVQFKEPGRND